MTNAEKLASLNEQIRKAADTANKQMEAFLNDPMIPAAKRVNARNFYNEIIGKKAGGEESDYRPRISARRAKSVVEARARLAGIEQIRGSSYSRRSYGKRETHERRYWSKAFGIKITGEQWKTVRSVLDEVIDLLTRAGIASDEALSFAMSLAASGATGRDIILAAEAVVDDPDRFAEILKAPGEWTGVIGGDDDGL